MAPTSFARRERHAFCETALAVGAPAPTLCEGWDAADLVAHCLVRERRPLSATGFVVPALSGLAESAMARVRRRGFEAMVRSLRDPGPTPFALPPVERLANTLEYVVHHEDLRRAQPDWEPRELTRVDLDAVWSAVRRAGPLLVRAAGVPVVLRRADTGEQARLRRGEDPVVVAGGPVELALALGGRDEHRDVTWEGPPERVTRLRGAL